MNKRRAKAGGRRPRPESHPALYRAQSRPAIDMADVKGYLAFRHKLREQSGRETFAEAKDVMVKEQREKERERAQAALHPNGQCTCAGEGRCEWCVKTEASIEAEDARPR